MKSEKERFADADEARFFWATKHPAIAYKERELLAPLLRLKPGRLLEAGCGNGSNLRNLRRMGMEGEFYGFDPSFARAEYTAKHIENCAAVCADGLNMPYADSSFDVVFFRDVFHHVEDKKALLAEAVRVARPGGKIVVIEPNPRKMTVRVWAKMVHFDSGILLCTRELLTDLFRSCPDVSIVESRFVEKSNFSRVVYHHKFGFAWTVFFLPVRLAVDAVEWFNKLLAGNDKGAYLRFMLRVRK